MFNFTPRKHDHLSGYMSNPSIIIACWCLPVPHPAYAHVCPGAELTSCRLVPGAGHDAGTVPWVYRAPPLRLLPYTVAAVETLLRRGIKCEDHGQVEEQLGHPRVEQIQRSQKRHGGFQATVWTHCSKILPQSVFPLWPTFLRQVSHRD